MITNLKAEWGSEGNSYRSLTYMPNGLYGELVHQTLYGAAFRDVPGRSKLNESLWFHQNDQGSTIALTDDKGHTVTKYRYTSFGQVTTYGNDYDDWGDDDDDDKGYNKKRINSIINPYLYLGKETDLSTGLVQLDARTYDPRK